MGEISQIKLVRKYLKIKLIEDKFTFRSHRKEATHLFDLLLRTVESGESNSAIVIGPRGSGKTTLINGVLAELNANPKYSSDDSILVKLNGNVHCDDKTALKAITTQMSLENVIGDRVFGSFSENLAFLLSCLKSGRDKNCKSVLFILDEFDLFCHTHGSQTLLYNLFDVAQSKQAPICVIGLTCRLDVVELLEKRVKSRFSHRQIFIFPNDGVENENKFERQVDLFRSLLSLPLKIKKHSSIDGNDVEEFAVSNFVWNASKYDIKEFKHLDPTLALRWNEMIDMLANDRDVRNCLQKMYDFNVGEDFLKQFLIPMVCKLSSSHPQIYSNDIVEETKFIFENDRVSILLSLSVLEISLLIAMKHQSEIFLDQPMNFEMIYTRYSKFTCCNSASQIVPKAVVLKAFEHLKSLEFITPVKDSGLGGGYVQKEYQMYKLLITSGEISEAVNLFKSLPTELVQWASSSLV